MRELHEWMFYEVMWRPHSGRIRVQGARTIFGFTLDFSATHEGGRRKGVGERV